MRVNYKRPGACRAKINTHKNKWYLRKRNSVSRIKEHHPLEIDIIINKSKRKDLLKSILKTVRRREIEREREMTSRYSVNGSRLAGMPQSLSIQRNMPFNSKNHLNYNIKKSVGARLKNKIPREV